MKISSKNKILNNIYNKDDKMLISNILDKSQKYEQTHETQFSNFLDVRQQLVVSNILKYLEIPFSIYKFHPDCEKSIIFFGDDTSEFVTCFKFDRYDLTHRDVLGSLFSLGLEHDVIGDIFVEDEEIYLIILKKISKMVESNLTVALKNHPNLIETRSMILKRNRFIDLKIIVSSFRIDLILSHLLKLSRSKIDNLLKSKLVLVNYSGVVNKGFLLKEGDVISVRGYGKFLITGDIHETKKKNYVLLVKKYN